MTTYKLNKTRDSTWEITTSGDTWILGENGRIVSDTTNDAIFADSTIVKVTIRIDGEIDVGMAGTDGLDIRAEHAVISVSETGRIAADNDAIFFDNQTGSVTITNRGLLEAGYGVVTYAAQNGTDIRNSGHIHASHTFAIRSEGAGANIVNSGVIKAGTDGIYTTFGSGDTDTLDAANATHIINSGRITGKYASIEASGVAADLRNKGTLNGNVSLGDGQDVVNNHGGKISGDVWLGIGEDVVNNRGGTINGDIMLWDGNDLFDGRGGRLNGVLYGGDGNDIVTLASPATLYVELAGEGVDTVRINATYRLGANVEWLTLLGKADHTGIGNSLNNRIYGNKGDNALYGLDGNDMLAGGEGRDRLDGGDGDDVLYGHWGRDMMTGGAGADYFGFYAGNGRDTITDFEIGIDVIGLQGIDGIAGFADLDGKIAQSETNPSDTIIRLGDADMFILRDMIAANLTANDFDFH